MGAVPGRTSFVSIVLALSLIAIASGATARTRENGSTVRRAWGLGTPSRTETAAGGKGSPKVRAAVAGSSEATRVIHLVASIKARHDLFREDPLEGESRKEHWVVEGGEWWRDTTEENGFVQSEDLVRDGVLYALQANDLGGKATRTVWFNMLEYDACDPAEEECGARECAPMDGNPDYYREALESGSARLVERAGTGAEGTLTLAMRHTVPDRESGTDTTVVVRTEDFLPVRATSEWWVMTGGRREPQSSWEFSYEVAEVLAWDDVPPGVLELEEPPGVLHQTSRHLRIGEASAMNLPSVWWVGERFDEFELAEEPFLDAAHGGDGGGRHTSVNLGPDPIERADVSRPAASQASTEVVVHYEGPDGADLKVCSIPRADTSSELLRLSKSRTDAVRWATVNLRSVPVVRAEHTWNGTIDCADCSPSPQLEPRSFTATVVYVLLDMPEATVIVQGWRMPEQEVLAVAGRVRRIGR